MRSIFKAALVGALVLTACGGDDAANDDGKNAAAATAAGADALVLHQEYTIGVGGYMYATWNPYLLYADGSIYSNLATSPDDLDPAASKVAEPKSWGKYTRSGGMGDLAVTWSSGETEAWAKDDWQIATPGKAGQQLNGAWTTISGGGNTAFGGDVVTVSSGYLAFEGDRFTSERGGGGTTSAVTAYASESKAGTYAIDGYTLTLKFDDGRVVKEFFYLYSDEDTDVFGVGDDAYVIQRD